MSEKQRLYDQYLSKNPCAYRKYVLSDFADIYPHFEHNYSRFLPENKSLRIADLGCGSGAFVSWLQRKGYENVEGIDISQEQIDAGAKLGVKNLKRADVFEYLRDCKETFALISAHDLVEHFEKDKILDFLSLTFQGLQRGGIVFISTLNADSLFGQDVMYGDFTHETYLTPPSLSQLLHFAGFGNVRIFPNEPVAHNASGFAHWAMWKTVKPFIKLCLLMVRGSAGYGIYTEAMYAVAEKPINICQ